MIFLTFLNRFHKSSLQVWWVANLPSSQSFSLGKGSSDISASLSQGGPIRIGQNCSCFWSQITRTEAIGEMALLGARSRQERNISSSKLHLRAKGNFYLSSPLDDPGKNCSKADSYWFRRRSSAIITPISGMSQCWICINFMQKVHITQCLVTKDTKRIQPWLYLNPQQRTKRVLRLQLK